MYIALLNNALCPKQLQLKAYGNEKVNQQGTASLHTADACVTNVSLCSLQEICVFRN